MINWKKRISSCPVSVKVPLKIHYQFLNCVLITDSLKHLHCLTQQPDTWYEMRKHELSKTIRTSTVKMTEKHLIENGVTDTEDVDYHGILQQRQQVVGHSLPEMEQKILDLKQNIWLSVWVEGKLFAASFLFTGFTIIKWSHATEMITSSKLTLMALSRMHWQWVLYIMIRVSTCRDNDEEEIITESRAETVTLKTKPDLKKGTLALKCLYWKKVCCPSKKRHKY